MRAHAASIRIDNLTVAYDRHPAVHHLCGAFEAGSMTAIVGPNGAGKSSLLKAMVGLLRPAEGRVDVTGALMHDIAYLPQQAELDRQFPICVADTVAMGFWRRSGAFGAITPAMRAASLEALDAVGLRGFESRLIGTLSVGQFQRVLFARVMVQDAPVILLDEPFNAIDTRTTDDLLALVHRWSGERRTIVAVLHDLDQVRRHFPETLLISRELIGWGATGDTLTTDNLQRARRMSEAWDEHAPLCDVAQVQA
jgi:zinc/manganese transport system ATP-binding protein